MNTTVTISGIISALQRILDPLIILIIGIALAGFLWGVALYIFKTGDSEAQERGKRHMFWGIVALFIMVSIWGVVNLLQITLFNTTDVSGNPDLPTLPVDPGRFSPPPPQPPPPPPPEPPIGG